ncbi:MAG: methyltransferase domain-containing protein [bacterium]|nr:MAG: methyltransferase domain-containing protein [bacterium]
MKKQLLILLILFSFLILTFTIALSQNKYRDTWQKPEAIMDTIGVKQGMVIGEAGSGEGYFTFWLSQRVGETGKIYANDIKESVLKKIKKRCEREGITNITTILGKQNDPLFPRGELDMVVMMLAFHEFKNPVKWLENAKASLKFEAPLVIIERDPEKTGSGRGHFMKKDEILETVKKANFELVCIETFLAKDNIFIFRLIK